MASFAGAGLSLGTLGVNAAANIDEAVKGLADFGTAAGAEVDRIAAKFDGLKNVGQSLIGVGGALTAAITLPLAGIGAAAVKMGSDFQGALNKITALGGQTGAELDVLRVLAMKLGAD